MYRSEMYCAERFITIIIITVLYNDHHNALHPIPIIITVGLFVACA